MSKRHPLPPTVGHEPAGWETPLAAAVRAAAEVFGRPLDPTALSAVAVEIPPWNQSHRDGEWKRYSYRVFTLTANAPPVPVHGHTVAWVSRGEIQTVEPLSPTVRLVFDAV